MPNYTCESSAFLAFMEALPKKKEYTNRESDKSSRQSNTFNVNYSHSQPYISCIDI